MDDKSIGLFSLKNGRFVYRAPIRGQCQRSYFYGKTGETEAAFSSIEGTAAQIFRDVIQSERPPFPWTDGHIFLMLHVISQHARTTYAANEQNDFTDHLWKRKIRPSLPSDGISQADLDLVKIELTDAVGESLQKTLPMFPLVLDLRCIVLVNQTASGFITSDNPVVLYNQFFEERINVSNTGLQSAGLQIYLPLSPTVACFFYDANVYGVGPKNPTCITLTNPVDVDQLNTLEYLSAVETIYFRPDANNLSVLTKLFERNTYRRRKRTMNFIAEREKHTMRPQDHGKSIGFFREDIRCGFRPSFLKTLKQAERRKPELLSLNVEVQRTLRPMINLMRGFESMSFPWSSI